MAKNTVLSYDLFPQCSGRLLVVDDEEDIALVLKKALESYGFTADAFSDSVSALRNFKAGSYDLVITDVKMPEMDGFQLHHEIKKIDGKVKVCFLTAYETYREEIREVKCFIKKPVSIGDLVEIVKSELGQ